MKKKGFSFLMALTILLGMFMVFPVFAADTYIPFYNVDVGVIGSNELYPNDGRYDIVGSANVRDNKFSVMFNSAVPFKGVKLYAHGAHSPVTISLYAWNKDYETTIAGTPVLSESSTLGGWNYTSHIFTAGEQAAGIYILVYTGSAVGTDGPAQIWRFRTVSKNVNQYLNDTLVTNGTFEGGLIVDGNYTRAQVFVPYESYVPFYDGDISFITESASMSSYAFVGLNVNKLSVLFNAAIPFKGVKMYVDGSANSNKINVSLYAWDTDYETTLNGTKVLSENAAFGDWYYKDHIFTAGEQPAGQYVIVFEWQEGTSANIHRHINVSDNIQMFLNDELVTNGTYESGLMVDGAYIRDQVCIELESSSHNGDNPYTGDKGSLFMTFTACVVFVGVLIKKRKIEAK